MMSAVVPKYHLLYFKCLLDAAFLEFIEEHQDDFICQNGEYYLSEAVSLECIQKHLATSISNVLKSEVKAYDKVSSPDVYFIIGACQPAENFLLKYKSEDFPASLLHMTYGSGEVPCQLKYVLAEKDIHIGIVKFNEACCNVFNDFFKGKHNFGKNVVFVQHQHLDCYSMFKVLKCMLGKANCINMHSKKFAQLKQPIVAVNDLIDKQIRCKTAANRDPQLKKMYAEVKQYVKLKLNQLAE